MSSSKPSRRIPSVLTALVRYTRTGVRSERDVRAYLRRRGLSADETARLVTLCRARSVIDDRAGACLWADHWARQGYAWRAIRAKLAAKGFADAAIAPLTQRVGSAEAELARARVVASTARGRSRPHLVRKLSARGFEDAVIEEVVRDAER